MPTTVSAREFLRHPLAFTLHRLAAIFREDSAWAEFSSAVGMLAFGSCLLLGRGAEDYRSFDLMTEILPGHGVAVFTVAGGLVQLFGLFFRIRFLRAIAAMGVVMWLGSLSFLVWPIFPWSPFLAATAAWTFPNLLVVAKHARDW
ncbi:hypothetical protein GXW78_07485 [Roseomonas terrae]|uniref:DoxX family protein n=1 Tax=Neoroseomonas terrae TaxID=424799 RepID=A0ABS5EEP5_9PROT|nr:hypothetical protein [Neoroseomonas terrae]MBR0649496.1 hypothetical protein [Neoroseomonas terrae]